MVSKCFSIGIIHGLFRQHRFCKETTVGSGANFEQRFLPTTSSFVLLSFPVSAPSTFSHSLSVQNSTCFPMRSALPDKERSARHGKREGVKEKRQRRASGWSYSLITCLPCKCSSKELHRQLQETATPFQIIKYWPIKVRTWEWASSSHSLPAASSSSSSCLHFIASISSSISLFAFLD